MPVRLPAVFASLFVAVLCLESRAEDKKPTRRVRLASTYQSMPLDFQMKGAKFRQVALLGDIKSGAVVAITLDPNTCTVNQFGDPSICTLIAQVRVTAKLSQLRIADRGKPPRRLFRLTSANFPESIHVYLVAPRGDAGYRLVLDTPATKKRVVVPLEKRTLRKAKKPRVSK